MSKFLPHAYSYSKTLVLSNCYVARSHLRGGLTSSKYRPSERGRRANRGSGERAPRAETRGRPDMCGQAGHYICPAVRRLSSFSLWLGGDPGPSLLACIAARYRSVTLVSESGSRILVPWERGPKPTLVN